MDEDGAGDEACGAPVAAAEGWAEGGGEEGHGDHDRVHGERVLVLEGAADLVDAAEVFHFEADDPETLVARVMFWMVPQQHILLELPIAPF